MADDDAPEITEETQKDREEAEQAKALNAVTDNVSGSSRGWEQCHPKLSLVLPIPEGHMMCN